MKIIEQYYEIKSEIDGIEILKKIEQYGRVCYKSENLISSETAIPFVERIIDSGHESVLEHINITIAFITDRGITHEIVRHRIASYSQESTRYCNYERAKFGKELTFIKPSYWDENGTAFRWWKELMEEIEVTYMAMVKHKISPQEARAILPNSLKTEIIVTMNLREWRHFFKLRANRSAHPQMQALIKPLLKELQKRIPIIFDNIK